MTPVLTITLPYTKPRPVVPRDLAAKWADVMERTARHTWRASEMILLGEALEALTGQPACYEFTLFDISGSLMGELDIEWHLRSGAAQIHFRYKCHLEDFHSVNTDADETRIEGLAPGQVLEWGGRLIRLSGIADAQRCRRLSRILPRLYAEGGAQGPGAGPQDCAVLLVSPGSRALQVIAALCKLAGLSPQQAKDLAADAPVFVLEGIDRAKAEEAQKTLAGLGAAAEVW